LVMIVGLQFAHGAELGDGQVAMLHGLEAKDTPLKQIRKNMHAAVVSEIAKRDAEKIFNERKTKMKKIQTAELVHSAKDAQEKVIAHMTAPEGVAKIKQDIKANVQTIMKQKEVEEDKQEARKQVDAMVHLAIGKSRSTKELVKEAKEGVENVDRAEEMHAAKEALEADVPNPDKVTEEKLQEQTKNTIEKETNKAAAAVAAKVSSPEEKLAIKQAMSGIMAKAVNTAAEQVSEDVAKHIVFHHHYSQNGTLLETKMETPENKQALKKANDVAAQQAMEAKEAEAEKQKLVQEEQLDRTDPEKMLEVKSEADKAEEKAAIAREVVQDIKQTENDPENDTSSKLEVTKTKAKVKVIGQEAHQQAEKAKEKMRKGKVAELFEKKMTKHMKEVAQKNARMIKENAEKKETIARLKAKKIKRQAVRMENKAERQAERVERHADRDKVDSEDLPHVKAAMAKTALKGVRGIASDGQSDTGPWGHLEANGGIHVHVKVESTESDPSKIPKMTVENKH